MTPFSVVLDSAHQTTRVIKASQNDSKCTSWIVTRDWCIRSCHSLKRVEHRVVQCDVQCMGSGLRVRVPPSVWTTDLLSPRIPRCKQPELWDLRENRRIARARSAMILRMGIAETANSTPLSCVSLNEPSVSVTLNCAGDTQTILSRNWSALTSRSSATSSVLNYWGKSQFVRVRICACRWSPPICFTQAQLRELRPQPRQPHLPVLI